MEADPGADLSRRLDAIIYVLMNLKRFEGLTAEGKIAELKDIGFKDVEIARMIGRTRGYVASAAARSRRKGR